MKHGKILLVFGTRPEAIKMAPLVLKFLEHPEYDVRVCVTGQHREMLDQVLGLFEIVPDYDLDLMKPGQSLSDLSAALMIGLAGVYKDYQPSITLVHGDTTTAAISALSSYYHGVAVGHIEAGLRTNDLYSPWPEEGNRQITSKVTELHFCPTIASRDNLLNEGVEADSIVITGNTVIDALMLGVNKINSSRENRAELRRAFPFLEAGKKVILVTGHRRESFGEGFESICRALRNIAERGDVELVYPVHLNPSVREPVERILGKVNSVHLIEPLEYLPFIYLMEQCHFIITDSGGVQEEAPSLGKPVLVMRATTERPEAVEAGTVLLVGSSENGITKFANKLLDDDDYYETMSGAHNPYGDGRACERICAKINSWFENRGNE